MQSLILPPPSAFHPQLGQPRFDIDRGQLSFNLRLSANGSRSGLWAYYPPRLMSGAPLAQQSTERSPETRPQTPSAPQVAITNENPKSTAIPVPPVPGVPEGQSVTSAPTQRPLPSPETIHGHITTPAQPAASVAPVPPSTETTYLPHTASGAAVRTLPPRSTRRAKAHVASACVNCKRKHLGCDPARPCRRCVLAGKAATCVDVTHKKRGRPPLKAEEATLRPYPAMEGPAVSRTSLAAATSSSRGPSHTRTSSREIRPITDLQFPGAREYVGGIRGSGLDSAASQLQRWPHSVFPTSQVPPGSHPIHGSPNQRPFSSPTPLHPSSATYPPTSYVSYHPSGSNPMPRGVMSSSTRSSGQMVPYADPPYQRAHPASPPQYQQPFLAPVPSHGESGQVTSQPVGRERSVPREFLDPYNPLRLPPLGPSPRQVMQAPQGHRRSDSYPSMPTWPSWWREEQERSLQPQGPPHSLPEPTSGPSESRSQQSPTLRRGLTSREDPRGLGTAPQEQQLSARTHIGARRIHDVERDESDESGRRMKRRRMALDDIVND